MNTIIISKTWESVQLSWQPGFDGGYPQSFVVSYTSRTSAPGTVEVGAKTQHNVTLLYPSTNYTFAVFGKNEVGSGGSSAPVYANTECKSILCIKYCKKLKI